MTVQDKAFADQGNVTALLLSTLDQLSRRGPNDPPPAEPVETDGAPQITLGSLLDALDERAFGLLLLILALPCCIPFLWGIPQVVALPMLALATQLAMGRHEPWLPQKLQDRPFDVVGMRRVVMRITRYLGWLERLAAQRLTFLTTGLGARVVGAILLIPTASILVPLPSTNTAPGIGVAICAVGLLERDGLLVILGLLMGLAWVFLLIFFGASAVNLLKSLVLGS